MLIAKLARAVSVLCLAGFTAAALAQEAPDALVKRVQNDVVQTLKVDPKLQAGDPARLRELIETKMLPNFDFERMTALALGRNWKTATPEQQKQLVDQFRSLLVRTYSGALTKYRDESFEVKPLKLEPNATDTMVRTLINRPPNPPIQLDYGMARVGNEWKAYDVVVGGVSLVTNYRDEFGEQVRANGIDGLINTLTAKNKQPAGK